MSARRWRHVLLGVVVVLVVLYFAFFMDWLAPVPEGEGPLGSGLKPHGEAVDVAPEPDPEAGDDPFD